MSGRLSTVSIKAASSTVRVIGPRCATVPKGDSGQAGTRPKVGFRPMIPQKLAGMRIDPPPSVPTCSAPIPSAAATAAPPLEPPGVRAMSQGLRATWPSGLSVTAFQPNSGVVVLPSSTAPASRSRAEAGASAAAGGWLSVVWLPRRAVQPRVRIRSLMVAGTPSSRPKGSPRRQRASDSRAAASAASPSTRQKAWTRSFQRSILVEAGLGRLDWGQLLAPVEPKQRGGAEGGGIGGCHLASHKLGVSHGRAGSR